MIDPVGKSSGVILGKFLTDGYAMQRTTRVTKITTIANTMKTNAIMTTISFYFLTVGLRIGLCSGETIAALGAEGDAILPVIGVLTWDE